MGRSYIGCDNDPLSLDARRELCEDQMGGLLYGGIEIMSITNPCGQLACYVFPGSNYGTVKSVAEYMSTNNVAAPFIKIVPFGWKVISEVLWTASYSNVTLTNFPVDWKRLRGSGVPEYGLGTEANDESAIVEGFCGGGDLSGSVVDQLIFAIDAMVVNGSVTMVATTSGSKTITFDESEVYPVLTEVGTRMILDGVEVTSATQRPITFRPAAGDQCTVFNVEATDATFRNLVFDLSGCIASGIDATPIVFSGSTGRGALVDDINVIGGDGAAIAFVGRETGAFLFSPEIGVSGATVRNVNRSGGKSFIVVAFAAAVEDAIVGSIDGISCPDWPLSSTTVHTTAFGPLTLQNGNLFLPSGKCLGIESGVVNVVNESNCSYWWGIDGGGVHPWGAPILCPQTYGDAVVLSFCEEDCAVGTQALVVDDRPRVRQWEYGVTLTADGKCVDILGGVGPCDPAALYAETDRGFCNVARKKIDQFACAKIPSGAVAAIEEWDGCAPASPGNPSCEDALFGLDGSETGAVVECACVGTVSAAVSDCGLSLTSIVSGTISSGICVPSDFKTVTTASIAAAVNMSCADRCELFGGTCTRVSVSAAEVAIVDGRNDGRGAVVACADGAVVEGGYGWTDQERLRGRTAVARVHTVVVQPSQYAVFDVNLGTGIGIWNVTDYTADFGDAFEIAVRSRPQTNDGSAVVVACVVASIGLAELIIFIGLNYIDDNE